MKDYNTYYHLKFSSIQQELNSRFKRKVIKAKGSEIANINSFIEAVLFEQKNITKHYTPNIPGADGYQVTTNYFKQLIVKEFRNVLSSFPEDLVNGFVKNVIPSKRKFHQENYEAGNQEKYEFDPRFMYDASVEEILDLIAAYYAYQDFVDLEYPKLLGNLNKENQEEGIWFEEEIDRSDKKSHYTVLTQEETVLLFKCLRAENLILSDRYLNKTNLARAVYYLTGFAHDPLRKKLSNPIATHSKRQKRKLSEKLQKIIDLLDA